MTYIIILFAVSNAAFAYLFADRYFECQALEREIDNERREHRVTTAALDMVLGWYREMDAPSEEEE